MREASRTRGGRALAAAVRESYREGGTDYSLDPVVAVDSNGKPIGRVQDGDSVIFCCRRGEREVELTEAFTEKGFSRFERAPLERLRFVILTLYHEKFRHLPVAFAPSRVADTLGETLSRAGLRQLRVAESEKFAHVTYFLDGGRGDRFPGEDAVRVPSPHGRPFEEVPALNAEGVALEVERGIAAGYDFIAVNFANGDVIGHTADFGAKVAAAEAVDAVLARVSEAALGSGYAVFVTADHGNIEEANKPDGSPHLSHTTNPVPFLVLDRGAAPARPRDGSLADVAPTLLEALGVDKPAAMTGASLLPGRFWGARRRALLVILDGWGLGREDERNPIFAARTPYWNFLLKDGGYSRLEASGEAVGLVAGKPGNSEAGHMNLGAGRVVPQDDVRLDAALKDGSFSENQAFAEAIDAARSGGGRLHLIGLLSERSSHGSIEYPLAIARMARSRGLEEVYLHLILDGRSTEPGSAPSLLETVDRRLDDIGAGRAVTVMGRGIALDRGGDYDKIRKAYEALVLGTGRKASMA